MRVDAFISYSHASDARLAPELERGLERLARPWNRLRAVSVFRDQTDLSLTPDLWSTIVAALDDARWFVLLASPRSAASEYCNREVAHFCDAKGTDRVLIVLTDGDLAWDDAAGDFAAASTSVPAALRGRFANEPLWLDLRWARDVPDLSTNLSRFRAAVAQIAAPIRGMAPDELEGEDVRLHRRARRLARGAVAALAALAVAAATAAGLAVRSEQRAVEKARVAVGRQTGLAAIDLPAADLDRAFLMALAAARLDPAGPARFEPARILLGRNARLERLLHLPAGLASLSVVAVTTVGTDRVVATARQPDGGSRLVTWRPVGVGGATGVAAQTLPAAVDAGRLVPVAGGSLVVGGIGGAAVRVAADGRVEPLGRLLALDPGGAQALTADDAGRVTALDVATGVSRDTGLTVSADVAGSAADLRGGRAVVVDGGSVVRLDPAAGAAVRAAVARDVVAAAVLRAGRYAAVTVSATAVTAWRSGPGGLTAAAPVALPAGTGTPQAVVPSPDGRRVLVVGASGSVVVDVVEGSAGALLSGAGGRVAVDPSGRYAAVGGRRLTVWDLVDGDRPFAVPVPVNALAWSSGCAGSAPCRLATVGESLDVWEPGTRRRVPLTAETNAQAVAVSADGASVVTAGWGTSTAVWSLRTVGAPGTPLGGPTTGGPPVVVDPAAGTTARPVEAAVRPALTLGGSRLVDLGSAPVRAWESGTGRPVPLDHRCRGSQAALSPTSGLVVAREPDGLTTLCRLDTGAVVARARVRGAAGAGTAVAVDDDGGLAVGGDGFVERYARNGSAWRPGLAVDVRFGGAAVDVRSLALRGGVLAAGLAAPRGTAENGRVLVWDADRSATPVQFDVDQTDVPAVALLGAQGSLVAVAGRDAAAGEVLVTVWETGSRRRVGRGFAGLRGDVAALGGSLTSVVGADAGGRALRWRLDTDPGREVCAVVGRAMGRDEWADVAGGALAGYPYDALCPTGQPQG